MPPRNVTPITFAVKLTMTEDSLSVDLETILKKNLENNHGGHHNPIGASSGNAQEAKYACCVYAKYLHSAL